METPPPVPVVDWPDSIFNILPVAFWTLATCIVLKSFIKGLVNTLPAVDAVGTAAFAADKSEGIGIKIMEFHQIPANQHFYFLEQFPVYSLMSHFHKVTNSNKLAH